MLSEVVQVAKRVPVFGSLPEGNFPFLALPRPGRRPFVVRRDVFMRTLRLVAGRELSWELVEECDGQTREKLILHHRNAHGHGTIKFHNALSNESWPLKQQTEEWLRLERRRHGQCNCWDFRCVGSCYHVETQQANKVLTTRQRQIGKLERQRDAIKLHAPGMPWKVEAPLCATCWESEYWHTRPGYTRHCSSYTPGTYYTQSERDRWRAWTEQKAIRREVMRRARAWASSPDVKSTAKLYKAVNAYGVTVKPWSKMKTGERRGFKDDFKVYLKRLWEACGLASKPVKEKDYTTWGKRRYADWLETLYTRKNLDEMITALKAGRRNNGGTI